MSVSAHVQAVLDRMAEFEAGFDAQFAVDKTTGEFLHDAVKKNKPKKILELGAWRGASAIYMADALEQNAIGHLTSVEKSEKNVTMARANIEDARLSGRVTVIKQPIDEFLAQDRELYDLIFIDAEKSKTRDWLAQVVTSHASSDAIIIIDDVIKDAAKMPGLRQYIKRAGLASDEHDIGNGLLVVHSAT